MIEVRNVNLAAGEDYLSAVFRNNGAWLQLADIVRCG
jgi:hypothetical protein